MKSFKLLAAASLLALTGMSAAYAHSSISVGIGVGVPVYGPRYYGPGYGHGYYGGYYGPRYYGPAYYPYYAAPVYSAPVVVQQPVVVQPQPQVYIEQQQPQTTGVQPRENSPYWYFCAERNAYYPYVKSCPSGWQQVSPTPQQNP